MCLVGGFVEFTSRSTELEKNFSGKLILLPSNCGLFLDKCKIRECTWKFFWPARDVYRKKPRNPIAVYLQEGPSQPSKGAVCDTIACKLGAMFCLALVRFFFGVFKIASPLENLSFNEVLPCPKD